MKCDKLQQVENPLEWGLYYDKNEVDAAIDELKREHHRERHEYIDMVAQLNAEINRKEAVGKRWFERCMEARAENVRLKRALWMARKAHAVAMFYFWDSHYRDNPNAAYRNRTIDWLRNRWLLILDSIIKKEKEYK